MLLLPLLFVTTLLWLSFYVLCYISQAFSLCVCILTQKKQGLFSPIYSLPEMIHIIKMPVTKISLPTWISHSLFPEHIFLFHISTSLIILLPTPAKHILASPSPLLPPSTPSTSSPRKIRDLSRQLVGVHNNSTYHMTHFFLCLILYWTVHHLKIRSCFRFSISKA